MDKKFLLGGLILGVSLVGAASVGLALSKNEDSADLLLDDFTDDPESGEDFDSESEAE